MVFDKRQTNIAKGVAVLLLLWHHLFYNSVENYNSFISLKILGGVPIECKIAVYCKICVAIFVFLSGFGMFKSIRSIEIKHKEKDIKLQYKYVLKRLVLLFSEYWFVFIIFVPLGFVFGRSPLNVYDNFFEFIGDFLGLSTLYKGATMNETWWYITLIIVIIVAFPFIYNLFNRYEYELCIAVFILQLFYKAHLIENFAMYLFCFILGMFFAKDSLFEKYELVFKNKQDSGKGVLLFTFIIAIYFKCSYFKETAVVDSFFAIIIICFSCFLLSKIRKINIIFEILGKYSGEIFMFHTFIFKYYFRNFIYSFRYSIIIYIIMVIICFIIAYGLDKIKVLIGYNKCVKLIIAKVGV